MWIPLTILVVAFLALVLLPLGVEVSSEAGRRKWYLILAGLRVPMPAFVVRSVDKNIIHRNRKFPKRAAGPESEDLAGRSRHTQSEVGSRSREFSIEGLSATLDLVFRVLRVVRLRVHRLHIHIATPDPALTGIAYGLACAVIGALPSNANVSVDVDWTSTAPEFSYRVEVSVLPWQLLTVTAGALWRKVHA